MRSVLLKDAQRDSIVQYLRDVYASGSIAAPLDAYAARASRRFAVDGVYRRAPGQPMLEWRPSALDGSVRSNAAAERAPRGTLLHNTALSIAFRSGRTAGCTGRR